MKSVDNIVLFPLLASLLTMSYADYGHKEKSLFSDIDLTQCVEDQLRSRVGISCFVLNK